MMIDLYELTMANGYFVSGVNNRAVFDVFYRRNPDGGGYAIFAGLAQVLEYLENMHFTKEDIDYLRGLQLFHPDFLDFLKDFRFRGDVYAFPEGTVMYPGEPCLTVVANLIEAQLVETAILAQINHQSLIATKAARIVKAAQGRSVADFGARRAHNMDAATYGARAAFIGGVNSTATVSAGQLFNIPLSGTMAHSWVMFFQDEFTAFKTYALLYPKNTTLLVDTYDTLHSGIPNAIRVAKEVLAPRGQRLQAVRIDSGDLAWLSKKIRSLLDDAGLTDCKITASNSLDEFTISSLLAQGAKIDSFGVGERLITAKSEPVFGAVYKLVAVEHDNKFLPRIKISENPAKISIPGFKAVHRIFDSSGHAQADLITLFHEKLSFPCQFVSPYQPWKLRHFHNCTATTLTKIFLRGGRRVQPVEPLQLIRHFVNLQLTNHIWPEEQRFENPHIHYIDFSPALWRLKLSLLDNCQLNCFS